MSKKLSKSDEYDPIFNRLIDLCEKTNISISNLLDMFATSRSAINAWKKGNISANIIPKIADYFNITTDYLLKGAGVVLKKQILLVNDEKAVLKENEKEMLDVFQKFDDREQIKIIGRMEEWLEVKHQREALAQKQRIVGVQVARRTDGKFVKEPLTAEEFERIESLPEDTDY